MRYQTIRALTSIANMIFPFTFPHWLSQCAFWCPPSNNSKQEDCVWNGINLGPFRQNSPFIIKDDVSVSPRIGHLFRLRSPAAVIRLIVSIFVREPIKRMPLSRLWSHVRIEILKTVPAFANGNSSTAVMMVILRVWIIATSLHCAPRSIFWDCFGEAMRSMRPFFPQASAGFGVPSTKMILDYIGNGPAITFAFND